MPRFLRLGRIPFVPLFVFIVEIVMKVSNNETGFVVQTFMTISSITIKSGTNGILPCRTKCRITLDLQKDIHIHFEQRSYLEYFFLTVPFFYTDYRN